MTGATLSVRLRQQGPIPLDVRFDAPGGSITALFGPSGSGKTTVLRAIAGLYQPQEATIQCGGALWTDTTKGLSLPAHRRRVGMVFQDYALFPHLRVREQIVLALHHIAAARRRARADELIALVELTALAERKPASLSGGQQQRVAVARALARDPEVLLLDEPFASVDWSLRESLRRELLRLHRTLPISIILVTHDFDDVAKLARQLVALDHGAIVATGSVEDLTANNAIPGLETFRDPAVALDAEVHAHEVARELTQIHAGDLQLWVPPIDLPVGATVRVQIPARDVILATRRQEGLSLHNMLDARVLGIDDAREPGLRLVRLAIGRTRILALITIDAVRSLGLERDAPVMALIKSVAVESFA